MDPDAVDGVGRVPHGGADADLLDFSVNVNPLVPPGVGAVYREALGPARRYPDESQAAFTAVAAEAVGCTPRQVIPTAGGLEAIRLAVATSVGSGDTALIPSPSFSEYAREVRLQGGQPRFVPHDTVLEADPADHALAVVCHPNNPTGDAYDQTALQAFARRCRASDTSLLVDEAFLGFTNRESIAGNDGVIVARSLTKLFGLPGLRAGYAVATGRQLERLAAARRTWNVGVPALEVGAYCLRQDEFMTATRRRVAAERRRMRRALSGRYNVRPSSAPFVLLDVGERAVDDVVRAASRAGIAIRDATTFRGLDAHIRVAVRLPEENDRLLEVLHDV